MHERAWLVVAAGEVEVEQGGETVTGGPGFLVHFDPNERHEVRAAQRLAPDPAALALAGRGAPEPAEPVGAACQNCRQMDPSRKRKVRLCGGAHRRRLPGHRTHLHELQRLDRGEQAQPDPARAVVRADRQGRGGLGGPRRDELRFRIRDRDGTESVPVVYSGVVPDPFREGREVIVSGELKQGTFVAERDSLVTKCPSKFTKEREQSS